MRFRVRVPASSANLGPGFDALAVALELFTTVDVVAAEGEPRVVEGPDLRGGPDLVLAGMRAAAEAVGEPLPGCDIAVRTEIPVARGLGSSAAAIVAGLVAANHLLRDRLSDDEVLQIAARLEGHGDNVSAALFGGVTLVVPEGDRVVLRRVAVGGPLRAVLFIPDQTGLTEEARAVVPPAVSRADAVANLARAALLVLALSDGDFALLGTAMQDRLHQPYRGTLFPFVAPLIDAAVAAGAYGASLSGAGPSVLALVAPERAGEVAGALADAARALGTPGRVVPLPIAAAGAQIVPLPDAVAARRP